MQKFNSEQMEKIKNAFETSPVWEQLNAQVKRLYEQYNRIPTDEEYQAVRTMILCKVAFEDKNVLLACFIPAYNIAQVMKKSGCLMTD